MSVTDWLCGVFVMLREASVRAKDVMLDCFQNQIYPWYINSFVVLSTEFIMIKTAGTTNIVVILHNSVSYVEPDFI